MGARTICSSCGGAIELFGDDQTQVVAKGDRFYHEGCIAVHNDRYSAGVPAWRIPRSW